MEISKMFSLSIYFGFLTTAVLRTQGDNLVKISPHVKLFETPENFQSALGVVPGAKSCGGPAEVLDWRYESCNVNDENICKIPSDGKKRLCHFTFVPSEPIPEGIFIRFNVTAVDVPSRIYDIPVPDSAVRGGRLYTLETAGSPTKEFQGKTMTFQYMIIKQQDNSVEACAETEFENV